MTEERKIKLYMPNKSALLSVSALCLFLFFTIQCGLLANQSRELSAENEALSAALADKEQAIETQEKKADDLPDQLAKATSMEEHETETGFFKKGGVYLIAEEEQLWTLRRMIAENMEIEPDFPAATASYRLLQDIRLCPHPGYERLFCLGTEKTPFCGSFDGDGHCISGYFPLRKSEDVPEAMFHMGAAARIENLSVVNLTDELPETGIHPTISELWQVTELEAYLPDLPSCSVQTEVYTWDLITIRRTVDVLRRYWEENALQGHVSVSITFRLDALEEDEPPEETKTRMQNIQTALCALAGPEYTEIIEEVSAQETEYLWFIRLEQIEGLTCCTFEISEPDYYPHTYKDNVCNYHIITEGRWEGKELPLQCLTVPYTDSEMSSIGVGDNYRLEQVDFNFDGKPDLLIHEGHSGGSGGSWSNYRALVWEENEGQFAYFPSFPAQVYKLEFDRQRIVYRWRVGAGKEYVFIFEIVNGEYVCTKYLLTEDSWDSEGNTVITLYYYEMGELVETHILSDYDERKTLYPDMDYWSSRV